MKSCKRLFLVLLFIPVFSVLAFGAGATGDFGGGSNYFDLFIREIPELLSQNSDVLVATGMKLYRGISVIMLFWFGAELVTGGTNGPRLLPLLSSIVLVGTVLTFYVQPIPVIGRSFRQLVTDEATEISDVISKGHVQAVMKRLDEFEGAEGIAPSTPFDVSGSFRFWVFTTMIAAAKGVTIIIIAFGFLADAVAGLVGPIFIPFFLVPGLDWMSWGWLKAFIQYAFYPVIANAYTFVMMQALLKFCSSCGPQLTAQDMASHFLPLLILLIAYVFGMLQLPSLVSSIFSGRSGESAFWKL